MLTICAIYLEDIKKMHNYFLQRFQLRPLTFIFQFFACNTEFCSSHGVEFTEDESSMNGQEDQKKKKNATPRFAAAICLLVSSFFAIISHPIFFYIVG